MTDGHLREVESTNCLKDVRSIEKLPVILQNKLSHTTNIRAYKPPFVSDTKGAYPLTTCQVTTQTANVYP